MLNFMILIGKVSSRNEEEEDTAVGHGNVSNEENLLNGELTHTSATNWQKNLLSSKRGHIMRCLQKSCF